MRVLGPRSLLTVGLVAVCAVLSAVIWAGLRTPPALDTQSAVRGSVPAPITLPEAEIAYRPLEDYDEIVDRPLFNETRARIEIAAADDAAEVPPEVNHDVQQLSLTGVVISTGKVIALIRDTRAGKAHRIERGHSLGEWKLEEVDKDRVTLRRDESERQLMLYKKSPNDEPTGSAESRSAGRTYDESPRTTTSRSGRRTLLRPR